MYGVILGVWPSLSLVQKSKKKKLVQLVKKNEKHSTKGSTSVSRALSLGSTVVDLVVVALGGCHRFRAATCGGGGGHWRWWTLDTVVAVDTSWHGDEKFFVCLGA